jgi:integrase
MQSEVLALETRQLDLAAGTIRLDPGSTKNDEGRVVYLTPELAALLTAHVERVVVLSQDLKQVVPWLFPHSLRQAAPGEPVPGLSQGVEERV